MPTSGGSFAGQHLGLSRPIQVRPFDGESNLLLSLAVDEAGDLLHRILAIRFGILDRFTLTGSDKQLKVRVEGQTTRDGRAYISVRGTHWVVALSEHEIDYWCRFLTEFALGILTVDHIDLEGVETGSTVTLRALGTVNAVDEAEARRRLGL